MKELPPILRGDALQQLAQLRDYLVRRARDGEHEVSEATVLAAQTKDTGTSRTTNRQTESTNGENDAAGLAAQLRALIVKTAKDSKNRDDLISSSVGDLSYEMRQSFLAKSEFGVYQQEISLLIEATARQIVESYGYSDEILATQASLGSMGELLARYITSINGEIRRGFLEDPDTHETVLGIAISQQLQFTGTVLEDAGQTYYQLSPGQTLGLYTSTGWQFWVNGRKVGWFSSSDGMLHTVSQLVENDLQIGDWSVSAAGGFGIKYVG